jgi:protein tyrosine phosphatase
MPLNTEFPSESENTTQLTGNASNKSDLSRSDSSCVENSVTELVSSSFDFQLTEGQIRRGRMADCETECSQITRDIYVSGYYVAGRLDILKANNITRIINCSSAVVENHFIGIEGMKYLSLNMVDGRQDDISWFLCEVIQFIISAKKAGERVLVHCEKGVSRSCSFVIAYRLWATGTFNYN